MFAVVKIAACLKADVRRYRLVAWSIMALVYMIVFFHRLAPGVVRDALVAVFGMSGAAFGHLASMYFYAYTAMQIPVGMLAESLGARKTDSAGIFLTGVGSMTLGIASSPAQVYLGR